MSANVNITNFLRGVDRAKQQQLAAVRRAVAQFGNHVIGDAAELAPVDTGFLKSSQAVGDVKDNGRNVSIEIGFNADYAAAVHERMEVHHPQGQAKYLETAMKNNAPKFKEFVEGEIRRAGGA